MPAPSPGLPSRVTPGALRAGDRSRPGRPPPARRTPAPVTKAPQGDGPSVGVAAPLTPAATAVGTTTPGEVCLPADDVACCGSTTRTPSLGDVVVDVSAEPDGLSLSLGDSLGLSLGDSLGLSLGDACSGVGPSHWALKTLYLVRSLGAGGRDGSSRGSPAAGAGPTSKARVQDSAVRSVPPPPGRPRRHRRGPGDRQTPVVGAWTSNSTVETAPASKVHQVRSKVRRRADRCRGRCRCPRRRPDDPVVARGIGGRVGRGGPAVGDQAPQPGHRQTHGRAPHAILGVCDCRPSGAHDVPAGCGGPPFGVPRKGSTGRDPSLTRLPTGLMTRRPP